MDIPSFLRTNVQQGKVALMLGAGASMEAKSDKGKNAPSAKELTRLLSIKFLGGGFSDYPLGQVAELAISESDLVSVQEYIRELFEPLAPTDAHFLLPKFAWHGIAHETERLIATK